MNTPTPARERLIDLIGDAGGATLADLRRKTGLSCSTLRQHLVGLTQGGVVERTRERRTTGRPPSVYRLTPRGALEASSMYLFLQAVLATLRARGQETDSLLRETLVGWRDRFPKIRDLPGEEARLDAARRLLFGDLETTEVRRTTDGLQFSLQTCPLAPLALEYGDPCCVARALIGSLVGREVEQSEWIVRGDPRCTFHIRADDAGHTNVQKEPTGS